MRQTRGADAGAGRWMDEGVVAALAWNPGGSGEGGDRESQTCSEHLPGPEPCAKYFLYLFILFVAV